MLEIRCSKLARPMVCAGSLFFDLPDQPSSAPAEEGTAAGEYLRWLLEDTPIKSNASNGVPIDSDMKFFIPPIAEEIKANAQTKIFCEQQITIPTRSGITIMGAYDAAYIGRDGRLYIDDLKYGWGIVDVKENWQLLGYAIGEILRLGTPLDVVLRIHQPRPHHEDGSVRRWELTYAELLGYKEQIEARMDLIAGGYTDLVTSPKCKYCPAAATACPAFNKTFYRGIETIHEFMQDDISETELSFQLDLVNRVSEVLKIKSDSIKALAVDRIKGGKIIPGYMTESNYGDRKWKASISPKVIETLTGKKIVEEVMLSPAKAEKLGIPREFVNSLVERPFLGQKLIKKDASAEGDKIFGKGAPK